MTYLKKTPLKLTESQLTCIKNRIKHWSTKDQVIDILRYRYRWMDDRAAQKPMSKEGHYQRSKNIASKKLKVIRKLKVNL